MKRRNFFPLPLLGLFAGRCVDPPLDAGDVPRVQPNGGDTPVDFGPVTAFNADDYMFKSGAGVKLDRHCPVGREYWLNGERVMHPQTWERRKKGLAS